jgi:NAD(P)-dependent dehydrogenase (short-subunit alcohol dehydrogenase family)
MDILIFGAAGHIGSAVSKKLYDNNVVLAPTKNRHDVAFDDNEFDLELKSVGAVIYCVGHCPPSGFLDAIKYPLSQYSPEELDREIGMHILGPFKVFQQFLPAIRDGGHFVFMSSATTRILQMPRDERPPIHIYHHLAAIAAEDALIEGMRMDPEVKKRDIKIQRIVPPAIGDSPFHQVEGGPKLPVTVTTAEVVDAIIGSLSAQSHQDVLMVPATK